jgi:2-methylcitrate dehydratase PrpD
MANDSNGLTQAFVDYAGSLEYEFIPSQVLKRTKELVLDFLGVSLGGWSTESTQPVLQAMQALAGGAPGDATVIGEKLGLPAHYASLVNGTMAHSMDFDDTHREAILHPGTPILSTLLALGETKHVSGRDFLVAAVIGYDVACKLGKVHGEGVHNRGFHPTPTTGMFGAVAAGGRLLCMDSNKVSNAMGVALSQASGALQFLENGAWNKRVHVGQAAHNAIISLTLANHGVIGASQALEGRYGYLNLYSQDSWDPELAIKDLGQHFEVMSTAVKPYPCCRYSHSIIDGVLDLAKRHDLRPEDVMAIEIHLNSVGASLVAEPQSPKRHPKTVVDAQFSVYFAAAIALLERSYTWDSYRRLQDPEVTSLMDRVVAVTSPEVNGLGGYVRITARDGAVFENRIALAKGEPESFLTWDELLEKFSPMAEKVLPKSQVDKLIAEVSALEEVEDLAEITSLLRPA